jgi:predicted nucleic acid-binding protein
MSDRVFLDANILVSAAWRPDSAMLRFWALPDDVELVTSGYAIVEADRNVRTADQSTHLYRLTQATEIVDEPAPRRIRAAAQLPAKDLPILLAAIDANATHLVTGDKQHFAPLYGRSIEGVRVLTPRDYLAQRPLTPSNN